MCLRSTSSQKDGNDSVSYTHLDVYKRQLGSKRHYGTLDLAAKIMEGLSKHIKSLHDEGIRHFMLKAQSFCDEIGIGSMFIESGPYKMVIKVKKWHQNYKAMRNICF